MSYVVDSSVAAFERIAALTLAVAALSACTSAPVQEETPNALAEADGKIVAEDYAGAMSAYAAFASAQPAHPETARAVGIQKALERLVAAQAALARTQQGGEVARRELADLRAENERLRGEVAKLRADLERLRSIDLPARAK